MNLYRHKTLLALMQLCIFSSMLGVGIIVPFLPLYARSLGASALVMGLIFSAFSFTRTLSMPYVGMLSDRHGRRRFLIVGLAGYAVLALALAVANTPWELVANRALQGIFAGMIIPVSMALVADITPAGREGVSFGSFNTALLLGFGVGPLIGGVVYDHWGLHTNFYLMAGLSLFSLVLVVLLVRDPERIIPSGRGAGWRRQWELARERGLGSILAARAGQSMGMGCFIAFLPAICQERGLSNAQVGWLLAANVLVMTAAQYPAGRLADRVNRVGLAVAGTALSGLCKLLLIWPRGFGAFMLLMVIEGLASGMALPSLTALAVTNGRRLRAGMGTVMGLLGVAMSLGVILGTVLGGFLSDIWGFAAAFWVAGAGAAAGVGMLFFQFRIPQAADGHT